MHNLVAMTHCLSPPPSKAKIGCAKLGGTWSPSTESCFKLYSNDTELSWEDSYRRCVADAPPYTRGRLAHAMTKEVLV